jgi:hypothetical protein
LVVVVVTALTGLLASSQPVEVDVVAGSTGLLASSQFAETEPTRPRERAVNFMTRSGIYYLSRNE